MNNLIILYYNHVILVNIIYNDNNKLPYDFE